MFVVVQDIGTKMQNVRLAIDDEIVARDFAIEAKRQSPDSNYTVHYAMDVIDYSTPHQFSEEWPLDPRLIDGRSVGQL